MPRIVESQHKNDFARVMEADSPRLSGRLELDRDKVKNGLGQLVLTLIKLLHELLERQAIRRMESDSLTEEQVERLGRVLMQQVEEIDRLRREFGLEEDDLNLDLGPLGRLL